MMELLQQLEGNRLNTHGLKNGTLNLPSCDEIVEEMNFAFVANDAFVLNKLIIKTSPGETLHETRRYLITGCPMHAWDMSCGKGLWHHGLPILTFSYNHNFAIYKIDSLVLCCCVLHNYAQGYKTSVPFAIDPDSPAAMPGSSIHGESHDCIEGLTGHPRPTNTKCSAMRAGLHAVFCWQGVSALAG